MSKNVKTESEQLENGDQRRVLKAGYVGNPPELWRSFFL